jgi:hypothetical protein
MTGPWPSFWKVGFRDDNGRVQAMDPMDGMDLMDARDDGRAVVGIDLAVGPSQKIYLSGLRQIWGFSYGAGFPIAFEAVGLYGAT